MRVARHVRAMTVHTLSKSSDARLTSSQSRAMMPVAMTPAQIRNRSQGIGEKETEKRCL